MRLRLISPNHRLHHVEPRAACGGEVQVESLVSRQPPLHRRALVGAGVVHDQVQRQIGRRFPGRSDAENE